MMQIHELKENENERIKTAIINHLKKIWGNSQDDVCGVHVEDAIAWLEKQCVHAKFINGIQVGDKVTRNEDGVLVNLSKLNRVAKKQGEQKLLYVNDNAKEMFIKALERVEEQNKKGYKLTDCDKNSWWEDFKAYTSCIIEQNPAAWSEEDEKQARQIERIVHDGCIQKLQKQIADWFKSIKERYTWKPSDEQIESLKQAKTDACGKPYFNALASLYINLKGY